MAREITVDNIRFTVAQELQCSVDTEEEYHKSEIGKAYCWPKQDEVASLSVLSGQFHPTAKIKAEYVGAGSFPEELKVRFFFGLPLRSSNKARGSCSDAIEMESRLCPKRHGIRPGRHL